MSQDKLISELNQLLSDFHIYYQNTRGFHWNIKGTNFFELHNQFEILYTEALRNIDDLAERILTIGGEPLHTFEDYMAKSNLEVFKSVSEDRAAVMGTKASIEGLIAQEGKVKQLAADIGDQETEDMMIGLINAQQKTNWMFRSWLGK